MPESSGWPISEFCVSVHLCNAACSCCVLMCTAQHLVLTSYLRLMTSVVSYNPGSCCLRGNRESCREQVTKRSLNCEQWPLRVISGSMQFIQISLDLMKWPVKPQCMFYFVVPTYHLCSTINLVTRLNNCERHKLLHSPLWTSMLEMRIYTQVYTKHTYSV